MAGCGGFLTLVVAMMAPVFIALFRYAGYATLQALMILTFVAGLFLIAYCLLNGVGVAFSRSRKDGPCDFPNSAIIAKFATLRDRSMVNPTSPDEYPDMKFHVRLRDASGTRYELFTNADVYFSIGDASRGTAVINGDILEQFHVIIPTDQEIPRDPFHS